MAIQITANLPTLAFPKEVDYPTQEDWAAFSAAAELNFGILGSGWSTQMQLWKTQANAMSTELNNSADIAQGLANYQGDWTSKGYTLGQTVSVSGIYYICKLTHSTGQNPTTGGSIYWNLALGNWSLKVNNYGNEAIAGIKTFSDTLRLSGDAGINFGYDQDSGAIIKYDIYSGDLNITPRAGYSIAMQGKVKHSDIVELNSGGSDTPNLVFKDNVNNTDFQMDIAGQSFRMFRTYQGTGPISVGDINLANGVFSLSASPIIPAGIGNTNAVNVSQVIGIGQYWVNVTASRTSNVTYTNTSQKAKAVQVGGLTTSPGQGILHIEVNGVKISSGSTSSQSASSSYRHETSFIVPAGATYMVIYTFSSDVIWAEL